MKKTELKTLENEIQNIKKEIIFQATTIRKNLALSALENILFTGMLELKEYVKIKNQIETRYQQIIKKEIM